MKLRNKKTGGLANILDDEQDFIRVYTDAGWHDYDSLAEFNEEWEDYKPKEPKITDPEWCHVVRKWYDLSDLEGELTVIANRKKCVIIGWRKGDVMHGQEIDIPLSVMECDKNSHYTIDELCGEEEE